jgi:hypothetical protein
VVGDSDVRFKNPQLLLSDNPKDGWSMVWYHPNQGTGHTHTHAESWHGH